jgi:hypothetical protein
VRKSLKQQMQLKNFHPMKTVLTKARKTKTILGKQELKEFVASIHTL